MGFGVSLSETIWAANGLVTSRASPPSASTAAKLDVQALAGVNNMLFTIVATPDR